MDGKRSLNLNIFLKQFKAPNEVIVGNISKGDAEKFGGAERLKGLLKLMPEKQEVSTIQFNFYFQNYQDKIKWIITQHIRLKKINAMSQSSWQIGRPDLNAVFFNVFFFFSWAADVSDLSRLQLWNMELDIWMNKIQDTRQNTELKKSIVQSVSLCLSYLFLYILTI